MKELKYRSMIMLLALISLLILMACSSEDESPSNPLVGTWRTEVTSKGKVRYWDLTFTSDYRFSYIDTYADSGEIIEEDMGTYTVENGSVTINASGFGTSAFKINGDELTFSEWNHGKIFKKIK